MTTEQTAVWLALVVFAAVNGFAAGQVWNSSSRRKRK